MTPPKIFHWWSNVGEEEIRRIGDAIRNKRLSHGPITEEFERRIGQVLGLEHVAATTSGSMAILMALIAAEVGPGDEVIVPNRTWIATAHAPWLLGAKPVFVDVLPDCPVIDVAQVEARITARTKAIIPVHLNGRSADMRALNRIAARHGLKVIEDAAQAFGSRNLDGPLGTQSFAGCFSLSVAKIITTGQGGYVVTRDPEVGARLRAMRTHGVSDPINCIYTKPGFNFRFTDLLASIGLVQLEQLPERIRKLQIIYARYAAALPAFDFLRFVPVNIAAGEIPIYIEVCCPQRDRLVAHLAATGIQTRPFYPDLHTAPYFGDTGRYPNAEKFAAQGLFLPSGPDQPMENVERVLEELARFQP